MDTPPSMRRAYTTGSLLPRHEPAAVAAARAEPRQESSGFPTHVRATFASQPSPPLRIVGQYASTRVRNRDSFGSKHSLVSTRSTDSSYISKSNTPLS